MNRRGFISNIMYFSLFSTFFGLFNSCICIDQRKKIIKNFVDYDLDNFLLIYPQNKIDEIYKELESIGVISAQGIESEKLLAESKKSRAVENDGWLYPEIELKLYFLIANLKKTDCYFI